MNKNFSLYRWDDEHHVVEDSKKGEMHGILPMMHMLPEMDYVADPAEYKSPCYKTGVRAGVLSTTGEGNIYYKNGILWEIIDMAEVDYCMR